MAKPQQYVVKITGPGVSFDKPVSEETANEVLLLVMGGGRLKRKKDGQDGDGEGDRSKSEKGGSGSQPKVSLQEFLTASEAKRIPEKIVSIAAYLAKYRAKNEFSKEDLEGAFAEARESVPGNLTRDITWTIKIGWIALKQGEDSVYYLTNSGTRAVDSRFPPELRKKTKVSMGGRRKKQTSAKKQ